MDVHLKTSIGDKRCERELDLALIYPPWPVLQDRAVLQNSLPPLGILSIASYMESLGHNVAVYDIHGAGLSEQDIRKKIRDGAPRFIGISVLTNMAIPAHKVAKICRDEAPDAVIVMGGVHAEALPERMLRNSAVDVVVRGDGEESMAEIMAGKPFAEIPGLSFRKDGAVTHNPPRQVEMNLERFPLPAYHLVNFDNYFPAAGSYRNLPAINMLMTRGCPGKCSFCNSARTVLRAREAASMVRQVRKLYDEYGIRQVQFYDDTFTVLKKTCLEFCELLAAENIDLTWTAYIRGDCFSEDLAAAMKRAGCHQVLMGIETGSAEIAARIGKPIDKERYLEAVAIARRHGMEVRGSFIIGNMGETWSTMEETLQFAIDLDIDLFQLSISTPYPGTALYAEAAEKGALRHTDWYRYGQGEVLVDQPQISVEEIHQFERYAFRRFYMRPMTILRMLKRITRPRQIRDYFRALQLLVLGWGRQPDSVKSDWRGMTEEEFLDIELREPSVPRLTYQLRQEKVFT